MINGTLPISGIYQFLLCIMILSHSLQETLDTQRVFQGLAAQTSPGNLLEVQNLAPILQNKNLHFNKILRGRCVHVTV